MCTRVRLLRTLNLPWILKSVDNVARMASTAKSWGPPRNDRRAMTCTHISLSGRGAYLASDRLASVSEGREGSGRRLNRR